MITVVTTLIPMIGGFSIFSIDNKNTNTIKNISFLVSLLTLCLTIISLFIFDLPTKEGYTEEIFLWSNSFIRLGIDEFSFLFVPVIALVCFICVLWLKKDKTPKTKIYFSSVLIFEAFAIGSFYAFDMFLLFILIEATIIPIYIIMSDHTSTSKEAILQFMTYTITSALLILTAIIMIYLETNTSDLMEIYKIGVKNKAVFWLLAFGFGIKMPVWPFYHWLPVVHVKSQTICSVLLTSIILKFSTLLIIRFIEPLFLNELLAHQDIIICILLISMTFALSQLIFQDDLKKFFAYFSIIHLNMYFIILIGGLGKNYFIFSIIQHSILMAILFFTTEIIKTTFNTRSISKLSSLPAMPPDIKRLVLLAFLVLIAVPFSWGFICEIISIYAISKISIIYVLIMTGIVLISSLSAIHVYNSGFKSTTNPNLTEINDALDAYKKFVMYVLFGIILTLGIWPNLILNLF